MSPHLFSALPESILHKRHSLAEKGRERSASKYPPIPSLLWLSAPKWMLLGGAGEGRGVFKCLLVPPVPSQSAPVVASILRKGRLSA